MNRVTATGVAILAAAGLLSGCSILGGSSVQQFSVGECINDPAVGDDETTEVGTLPIVDCAEPHIGEVYYVEELTDSSLPADVVEIADEACYNAFEDFVGIPYEDSVLYFRSMYPTAETWAEGDRQIVCIIVDGEGAELTGSAEGTAQ